MWIEFLWDCQMEKCISQNLHPLLSGLIYSKLYHLNLQSGVLRTVVILWCHHLLPHEDLHHSVMKPYKMINLGIQNSVVNVYVETTLFFNRKGDLNWKRVWLSLPLQQTRWRWKREHNKRMMTGIRITWNLDDYRKQQNKTKWI